MSWLCPNEGEIHMVDTILADAGTGDWQIDLYTNDVTPDADTVFADLTLAGLPLDVDAAHWPGSTTNGAGKAESINTETYSWGGVGGFTPVVAYGWVIYKDTTILMIERLPSPPQTADDSVAIDVANIKFRLYN